MIRDQRYVFRITVLVSPHNRLFCFETKYHILTTIMSGLEVALIILVSVWTVIFIVVAIAVIVIFFAIKKTVDKFYKLLDETEKAAEEVQLPLKLAMAGVAGMVSKNAFEAIRKITTLATAVSPKKKKSSED